MKATNQSAMYFYIELQKYDKEVTCQEVIRDIETRLNLITSMDRFIDKTENNSE